MNQIEKKRIVYEMDVTDTGFRFASSLENAILGAKAEIYDLDKTINSVEGLKAHCDKLDYALAACSGAFCGLFGIFLVGKPNESSLGALTDKWFADRTTDFVKLCRWEGPQKEVDATSSAIRFLENKFKVQYDQMRNF